MANKLLSDLLFTVASEVADAFDRSPTPGPPAPKKTPPKPSRFAGENPKDESPAVLTRGALTGYAHRTAEGPWSLVVTGIKSPGLTLVPRGGSRSFLGDAKFDARVQLVEGSPVLVPKSVRSAWLATPAEWLYAGGTLAASVPVFNGRVRMLERLDGGMDIGEALSAAAELNPAALNQRLDDPAWLVAAAALDAIADTPERDATLERLRADRSPKRARLRVRASIIAQDWPSLEHTCKSLDSVVRSDAFEALLNNAPDVATRVAETLLTRMTGLDDYRTALVLEAFAEQSRPFSTVITPAMRERYLIALLAHTQPQIADTARELLVRFGTAATLALLGPDHASLSAAIRARIQGGGLALAEADGGLSIASRDD